MSENPPSHEEANANGGGAPSDEGHGDSPIADAIEALRKDYNAGEEKQQSRHDETITWQKRTAYGLLAYTLLTFIYTIATLVLVVLTKNTADGNTADSALTIRAWVDANGVSGQPAPGTYPTVSYTNTGREPAFGLVGHAFAKIAYIDPGEGSDWERNSVWAKLTYLTERNICAGTHPEPGRQALFVDGNNSLPVKFEPAEWGPIQGTQPLSHFAIVYGCLSYTTPHMKDERTTSFCYYFPPAPIPGIQNPPRCPTGNYAE